MKYKAYVTYDRQHQSLDVWKEIPDLHNPDWIIQLASLREMVNSNVDLIRLAKEKEPITIKITIEADE